MDQKNPQSPRYKPPVQGAAKAKEERLAAALRENLKKRKEQRRLRKEAQASSPD